MPPFSEAVRFHGHVCPKIVLGYRVAKRAMEELGFDRTTDEEIVAITLNDTCAVDAIQAVTGCTLGKGSLIFKDVGKMAFIFVNRETEEAVRISEAPGFEVKALDPVYYDLRGKVIRGEATEEEAEEVKRRSAGVYDAMLHMPDDELLAVRRIEPEIPEQARLFTSVRCSVCGEKMAESRARVKDGEIVCMECFEEYGRGW